MLAEAEAELRHRFGLSKTNAIETGVVLGTGWGSQLQTDGSRVAPMNTMGAFTGLEVLDGHRRQFEIATVNDRPVLVLRGRIHMNEDTFNPNVRAMVRLQIEVMIRLGVKRFVLTSAVGGLTSEYRTGDLVFIRHFLSWGQEVFPLFPGEFKDPERCLCVPIEAITISDDLVTKGARHVFFRGTHFESRTDKRNMASMGGHVVGMSLKPECAVAALHPGVKVVPLGYITNDNEEAPEHGVHLQRARDDAERLSRALNYFLTDYSWTP